MHLTNRISVVAAAIAACLSVTFAEPVPGPTAAVKPADGFSATVPAAGSHPITLPVTRWGRYSLRCTGTQPVSLSVADRRNGVLARDGDMVKTDPRIDLFLDIGEYKLMTQGSKKASGTTTVTATPFALPVGFKPVYLVPLRENKLSLDDLQQAFFWFETETDTTIYIEACGRNLTALELWRDGEWLVESRSGSFVAKPTPETPLLGKTLSARVPKGSYMVAAYGGKSAAWATGSNEHPLFIKWGIDPLAANVTTVMRVPSKGYVQLLLDPEITAVVVQEPEKKQLLASIKRLDLDYHFSMILVRDSIFSKSVAPRIILHTQQPYNNYRVVEITGTPGQPFTLQTFTSSQTSIRGDNGTTWRIQSLTTGNYTDQIGASGLVVDPSQGTIIAQQADTISADKPLAKRFNLLSPVTAFVWIENEGKYSVAPGESGFKWRLCRYFYSTPPDYAAPEWRSGPGTVDLIRGVYQLECDPVKKGIATIQIQKASLIGSVISAISAADKQKWSASAPAPSVSFTGITPPVNALYSVILNSQSPELSSVSCRKLPLNPDVPFGFWSDNRTPARIPVKLPGRRIVSVTDTRGATVPFTINGKQSDKPIEVDAGEHTVTVASSTPEPQCLVLSAQPPETAPSRDPPAFPDEKRLAIPGFASITPGKTVYLELDRQSNVPYAIKVTEPGLYRIETTGRLQTQLEVRDRFLHFTRTANSNGTGRNAQLIEYLLSGEYQVTVSTVNQSAGRLGVAVYRNPLLEGGTLEPNIDNRNFIEAYSGAGYDIRVPSTGRYRIESIGLKGNFPLRLEDNEGWPFDPAQSSEPLSLELQKGQKYRLISLPSSTEGRRIARLVPLVDKRTISGKGPHALELNTTLSSTWEDVVKQKDSIGAPAVFEFDLPSPISAALSVSSGFKVSLFKAGDAAPVATWTGRRKSDLTPGAYRLEVTPERKRNQAPYQVSVTTRDLIPGLSYNLNEKETFRINVGTAGIVELGSQGMLDVVAKLYKEDNKTPVAENDDGFLDWNFSISRALQPGRYFLRVESAEEQFTSTTIFMRALADTLMEVLACKNSRPYAVQCDLERKIGVFPLAETDTGEIIACAITSRSHIGCAIEKSSSAGTWTPVALESGTSPSLSVPRAKKGLYRLKVWAETSVNEKISIAYYSANARLVTWKNAESGISGQPEQLGALNRAWYKIDLESHAPGHIRISSSQNTLTGIGASTTPDSAFVNESPSWFSPSDRFCWVELRFEEPEHFRVSLAPLLLEKDRPLTTALTGNRPRVFETRLAKNCVALLTVETDGHVPLCGVTAQAANTRLKIRGIPIEAALWTYEGRAAAVSLFSDARRAAVWNALPAIDGTQPPALLSWAELPLSDGGNQTAGASSWNAITPSARVTHLEKGVACRLRVTLPPKSAAMITRSDGSRALECSFENEPQVKEFISDGGDLYLLSLEDSARFDISTFMLSIDDKISALADQSVTPGISWQAKFARPGTLLLPLAANGGQRHQIFFKGAIRSVGWIGADGGLRSDLRSGASVGPGGFLTLTTIDGWAKINLCSGSQPAEITACKWGSPLQPSGTIEIAGSSLQKLHDRVNWFSFVLRDTQHVNFSAPLPLAAVLLRSGTPLNYQEAWELFNWDFPLPPGKYFLGIRPAVGSSLEGGNMAVLFRPVQLLTEKQPFTCYIVPGESRLLSFDVAKKDSFGIGLSMTKETVQARLYDAGGRLLQQGKQQFVSLTPGKYHLWLRVPASSEGTQVTARLFGQEPPPNEPPERLVKWIINGSAGPRPSTESAQEDDDSTVRRTQNPGEGISSDNEQSYEPQEQQESDPEQGDGEMTDGQQEEESGEGE